MDPAPTRCARFSPTCSVNANASFGSVRPTVPVTVPLQAIAPRERDGEIGRDGRERDRDHDDGVTSAAAGHDRADHREVDGHREIFEHEQVEDRGRLAIAETVEVAERLRDDAR